MRYGEARKAVESLRERFDEPYDNSDKRLIEQLYLEALGRQFVPTTCQQCYHDAVIEIYLTLKKNKKMAKKCKYRLLAGFIISCPDFKGGKIFTNDNLTDKVAKEYLDKYPKQEKFFAEIPAEEGGDAEDDTENGGDGRKEGGDAEDDE